MMKCSQLMYLVILLNFQHINSQIVYQDILTNISATVLQEISPQCQKNMDKFSISTTTFWMMVDSSSRIPSGILEGNIISMGNYDECLDIEEVETKFCKAEVTLNISSGSDFNEIRSHLQRINTAVFGLTQKSTSLGFELYFCVFKDCTAEELNIIFSNLVHFKDEQCLTKTEGPDFDGAAITAIVIFSLIALVTICATVYDIFLHHRKSDAFHPLAIAFSLYTNGRKLFYLGNSQQLQCLNGLKSLSMLWVVFGHVYMAYIMVPLDNYVDVSKWMRATYSQYVTGATVSVDTFFVIGGFLTIYTFQTAMDKGTKFNIYLYYFHRYLRLTPALAAMVLAHAAVFKYLGSGPVWNDMETMLINDCRDKWWSALLYVQNYANPNQMCVPQSWYLSVDMQLFLISPIMLILFRRSPFFGYITLIILSVLSTIGSFLVAWFYDLGGTMISNISNTTDYMNYYYFPTHTRMVPYLFGIMLGYAIYNLKAKKKNPYIKPRFVFLGWLLALGLMATCIFVGHTLQTSDYRRLDNSFFVALMRPTWAAAICWVIFACVLGYGGPVDSFLSLPTFQILSRLCYSIYLVHYSWIFITNLQTRKPLHFSDYAAFHKFWGDLVCSIAIAVLWTLIFESPIIVIEKAIFRKKGLKGGETKPDNKPPIV